MSDLNYQNWQVLLAIFDGFIPSIDPSKIEGLVDEEFKGRVDKLAALNPSSLPGFKEATAKILDNSPHDKVKGLVKVLKILSHRSLALLLTGSTKLFTEMTTDEKQRVLLSWHNSRFSQLNILFRTFVDMAITNYVRLNSLHYEAIGHPEYVPNFDQINFDNMFKHTMIDLGKYTKEAELETDVVIVGSGSGAGVAASRLSRQGYRVLVLEKGKYYHQSELNFNEHTAYTNLYENGGTLTNLGGSMTILAGNSLGGGSTVNWSASLKTPDEVRQQWSKHVPWYKDEIYDDAMDYVLNKMGCSTKYIKHSKANQIVIDGSKKLGWEYKEVAQNTGNQEHDCGGCCNGCPHGIKQGGVVNWLKDAAEHGTMILDECTVLKINHKDGTANGVQAMVKDNGIKLTVKAKKVIVACGSLQTPNLLQRSEFQNKQIGKGLKLHPSTGVLGDFKEKLNGGNNAILTSVMPKYADLDGKQHGVRIETLCQQPAIESHFIPWRSGEQMRKDLLRYNHTAAILVIIRERSSGSVGSSKEQPFLPRIEFDVNKFDCESVLTGIIAASDLLYVQGAQKITTPISSIVPFECAKPKEDRDINDKDYQKWRTKLSKQQVKPGVTPLGSAHQMASCRMSDSDSSKPLTSKGKLRDCSNVFVADGSTFPSASGVNPMISIMATAHVITGFVEQELKEEGLEIKSKL